MSIIVGPNGQYIDAVTGQPVNVGPGPAAPPPAYTPNGYFAPATAAPTNVGDGNSFESFLAPYMTPSQIAASSQPVTQAPTNAWTAGNYPSSPEDWWATQQLNQAQSGYDANGQIISGLSSGISGNHAANLAALGNIGGLIGQQGTANDKYITQSGQLVSQLGGYRDAANQSALQNLGNYQTGLTQNTAQNNGYVSDLSGVYQSMPQLQSQVSWAGDLSSQAAIADPQALAAQSSALGMLGGAANGSLDWQSQAAQAYADPKYTGMRDQGLSDLYGVSTGTKDVKVGQADPAAYAAAVDAMGKYKDLTTPEVTDAERFIYEQARLKQEQDERANRGAVMSNLNQRGMGGSGMELTDAALANQQTSQNRLLSDLGAGANAVNRSMTALQGYSTTAANLNDEANAIATGNENRQLAALGAYTTGSETAADASFDQAYKRGLGADNASASNQQTRMQGMIGYGNEANAMQDDAFNRGAAADQTAQFNRSQSIDVAKFNSNYAQSEQNNQWSRAQGLAQTGLQADQQNATNLTNAFTSNRDITNDNYDRDKGVLAAQDTVNSRENTLAGQQTDRNIGLQNSTIGINNTDLQGQLAIGGLNLQNQNALTAAKIAATQQRGNAAIGQDAAANQLAIAGKGFSGNWLLA